MEDTDIQKFKQLKNKTLIYSLLIDALGMLSYFLPVLGDIVDIVWAPVSGLLIYQLYKKRLGTIGGIAGFIEEIAPQTDIIPTASILWFIKFVLNKEKTLQELKNQNNK